MKNFLINLSILFLLFILSLILTGIYRYFALKKNILDIPNSRSSHTTPIPRGGGIILSLLWIAACLVLFLKNSIPLHYLVILTIPSCIIMLTGFLDDIKNLSAKYRLFVQIFSATLSTTPSANICIVLAHAGRQRKCRRCLPRSFCSVVAKD